MIQPGLLEYLSPSELTHLDALLRGMKSAIWGPLPGPQQMAWESQADVIGFGGAAGGGKTDLMVAKAMLQHEKSMIIRRNGTELTAIVDRIAELNGSRDGLNGKEMIWRFVGRQIEFGSTPNAGDERKYQGRPHDFIGFDETTSLLQSQVRFLMGWLRTTTKGQKKQVLMTFNPPTTAEGRWVIDYFAPWLDPSHPAPAVPGELRWFATVNGRDIEVPDGAPFYNGPELIEPQSRTFIPSRITDNPYLMGTGYMAQLQSLPEPLRSQMLYGDFTAGMEDDPQQVIPTAWVQLAQDRWKPHDVLPPMDSMGVDVARCGKDNTVLARRHGWWFDELLCYPGRATPDGAIVSGLTIANLRDRAPIHVDVIGVGASAYDFLKQARAQVLGINVAESARGTDKSGLLTFSNLRSQLWWRMRELLDPQANNGIALPRDSRLLADLCAPRWWTVGRTIYVESRDQIIERIQRSPDYASAVILAAIETPKIDQFMAGANAPARPPHDPFDRMRHDMAHNSGSHGYHPLDRMR
ncbi:terminase [Dongia sp.]|uniref:terminase n=1 Tax=Dongia sp. TaxID=1977262 RepID=UPI0035B43B97